MRLLAFECDRSLKMKSQISLYKSQIISNLHPPTGYAVYIFLHLVFMPQMGKNNQQHQQQDIFCGLPMIDDDYW